MPRMNFKDALSRALSVTKSYIDDEINNHTHDKYLISIPSEYITETELNNKGYATESYVITKINEAKLEGEDTPEINFDIYALKSELHNHNNKSILDGITSDKITEWNNKSTFSGSYNDLTNKPTIPTVTNNLTNDLKNKYDAAYTHSQSAHAPANAQKNSDITKSEIEAKLTGDITSHTHSNLMEGVEEEDLDNLLLNIFGQLNL